MCVSHVVMENSVFHRAGSPFVAGLPRGSCLLSPRGLITETFKSGSKIHKCLAKSSKHDMHQIAWGVERLLSGILRATVTPNSKPSDGT